MTYHGHVKNGTVVLDENVTLPEGVPVEVTLQKAAPPEARDATVPTLYEQFAAVIGKAKDLPPDLAENHDHYLHRAPKK